MSKSGVAKKLAGVASEVLRKGGTHGGFISNVMPYGVFVQFGKHSGLCHFSNVASNIDRSKLHKGQKVVVTILEIRPDNKLSLSLSVVEQKDHHGVLVIRNSQNRGKVMSEFRAADLAAIYAERKKHELAEKKVAAKLNAQYMPPPRTLSEIEANGAVPKKRAKVHQAKPASPVKKLNKGKKKSRSVWTISGGGFETHRGRH